MLTTALTVIVLAAPVGFREAPKLEPAASYVAGKPVQVLCAVDQAAWDAYLAAQYGAGTSNIGGATVVGSSLVSVDPKVCRYLEGNIRKPASQPLLQLGAAMQILVHESLHARGEADEARTD